MESSFFEVVATGTLVGLCAFVSAVVMLVVLGIYARGRKGAVVMRPDRGHYYSAGADDIWVSDVEKAQVFNRSEADEVRDKLVGDGVRTVVIRKKK